MDPVRRYGVARGNRGDVPAQIQRSTRSDLEYSLAGRPAAGTSKCHAGSPRGRAVQIQRAHAAAGPED